MRLLQRLQLRSETRFTYRQSTSPNAWPEPGQENSNPVKESALQQIRAECSALDCQLHDDLKDNFYALEHNRENQLHNRNDSHEHFFSDGQITTSETIYLLKVAENIGHDTYHVPDPENVKVRWGERNEENHNFPYAAAIQSALTIASSKEARDFDPGPIDGQITPSGQTAQALTNFAEWYNQTYDKNISTDGKPNELIISALVAVLENKEIEQPQVKFSETGEPIEVDGNIVQKAVDTDRTGRFWLLTVNGKHQAFNAVTGTFARIEGKKEFLDIFQDETGRFWLIPNAYNDKQLINKSSNTLFQTEDGKSKFTSVGSAGPFLRLQTSEMLNWSSKPGLFDVNGDKFELPDIEAAEVAMIKDYQSHWEVESKSRQHKLLDKTEQEYFQTIDGIDTFEEVYDIGAYWGLKINGVFKVARKDSGEYFSTSDGVDEFTAIYYEPTFFSLHTESAEEERHFDNTTGEEIS